MKTRKITRTLLHFKHLVSKFHVRITSDKDGQEVNFHNSYKSPSGDEYISLDIQSFVTLEFKDDGEWSRSKSITLTDRNLVQILKGLKLCIYNIKHGGVFAIKETTGEIVSYRDKVLESTVEVFNLGNNQRVVLQPGVIYDSEDDLTYEGVVMYINNSSHAVELTIDQIDSLYYTLGKLNMFEYSQMLINYYVSQVGKIEPTKPVSLKRKTVHPLDVKPDESMTSTIKKKEKPLNTFEGLIGGNEI